MIFNSPEFALFLVIAFFSYWMLKKKALVLQNLWVLILSYVFYGWWDWRFLSLIFASTVVDYLVGLGLSRSDRNVERKLLLLLSLSFNLGMFGLFKYYNFFIRELSELLLSIGFRPNQYSLKLILPVGISFYTFQTLSYSIDIYRRNFNPTRNFIQFAAYVSFFPQLVAGPIERASTLLPQFSKKRKFDYATAESGLRLILWGLIKKICVADTLAPVVDIVFENYSEMSGLSLAIGVVLFAFQIYGDFSGYSDIAIGTAKLFGFELMSNFKFPYFSRDVSEFWRRWHISLSTWFRDYLYIPLGGSRNGLLRYIRNVFIIFLVSGFWHGANWTFIVWGGIHALLFFPLLISGSNRRFLGEIRNFSQLMGWQGLRLIFTFLVVCLAWVFFRAESLEHAISFISEFSFSFTFEFVIYLSIPVLLLLIEWNIRADERLEKVSLGKASIWIYGLALALITILRDEPTEFIYFQF